ncbi:MAG: hypothetical protein LUH43_04825 [Clostridia bacterium]|nr:hypothetical protein [Clostridia bacterium]
MKKSKYKKVALESGFRTVSVGNQIMRKDYIWRCETSLYSLKHQETECPICYNVLEKDQTRIPVSQTEEAIVPVLFCPKCRKCYVRDSEKVAKLLRDNYHASNFLLDDEQLWNVTSRKVFREEQQIMRQKHEEQSKLRALENERRSKKLKSVESAALLISVCYKDAEETEMCEYIITNEKKMVPQKDGVFPYRSLEARELLTAAFHKSREEKNGKLNGREFNVIWTYPDDHHYGKLSDRVPFGVLQIGKNGGSYSSLKDGNSCEIVDLLLYSPYEKIYKTISATFNKDEGYCYTDICRYRDFVRRYGNPGVIPNFDECTKDNSEWCRRYFDELDPESFLHSYGYNVSATSNISTKIRQDILAEIMDLELLPQNKIISFLDWLIGSRTQDKNEIARSKWIEDKSFVENYRLNPERFLIAR